MQIWRMTDTPGLLLLLLCLLRPDGKTLPNTKSIEWYYGDKGKIVGPMSFEDVARRIIRARNEKHLVWTEGMTRWADAKTIPAFTNFFRANPSPLPASSISSEDEIWIKPGSRASPPVLPAKPRSCGISPAQLDRR